MTTQNMRDVVAICLALLPVVYVLKYRYIVFPEFTQTRWLAGNIVIALSLAFLSWASIAAPVVCQKYAGPSKHDAALLVATACATSLLDKATAHPAVVATIVCLARIVPGIGAHGLCGDITFAVGGCVAAASFTTIVYRKTHAKFGNGHA